MRCVKGRPCRTREAPPLWNSCAAEGKKWIHGEPISAKNTANRAPSRPMRRAELEREGFEDVAWSCVWNSPGFSPLSAFNFLGGFDRTFQNPTLPVREPSWDPMAYPPGYGGPGKARRLGSSGDGRLEACSLEVIRGADGGTGTPFLPGGTEVRILSSSDDTPVGWPGPTGASGLATKRHPLPSGPAQMCHCKQAIGGVGSGIKIWRAAHRSAAEVILWVPKVSLQL